MFCLSVLGTPVTKKRARTGVGVSKEGKSYRWATTPDSWYEDMIREAFLIKYPDAEPYGKDCCKYDKRWNKYRLDTKYYTDMDLPKLELIIIFYTLGGKVGDLDNYIKVIKDALNNVAFIDDRQFKHYDPYVISLDDDDYEQLYAEDCLAFDNCGTVERVDFIIREYKNPVNKRLMAIRSIFERDKYAIDLTTRYYNDYRENKKDELLDYAEGIGLNLQGLKKDEMVEKLIQHDLHVGGSVKPDGKVKKRK